VNYKMTFNRVYRFTAAHRLHSQQLSEQENLNIYDKCNNLNGHGHDYTLEVALQGYPDATRGMIIALVIIQYLWHALSLVFPPEMLYQLKLWETKNNYFELGAQQ